MARTFKDYYIGKSFSKGQKRTFKYTHHGVRKSKVYHIDSDWWFKPPSWFTNRWVTRMIRQDNRDKIKELLKITSRDMLEDTPEFHKGNKPNADWAWA